MDLAAVFDSEDLSIIFHSWKNKKIHLHDIIFSIFAHNSDNLTSSKGLFTNTQLCFPGCVASSSHYASLLLSLGDFMCSPGFDYQPCPDDPQIFISGSDLSPKLQTHIPRCLSTWIDKYLKLSIKNMHHPPNHTLNLHRWQQFSPKAPNRNFCNDENTLCLQCPVWKPVATCGCWACEV